MMLCEWRKRACLMTKAGLDQPLMMHRLEQLHWRKRALLMAKEGLDQPLMKLPAMKAKVAEVAVKHAMSRAKLDLRTPISLTMEQPAEHSIWAWLL